MRYLTFVEVLDLHRRIMEQSSGALGIGDLGLLESAIAQPPMTFGGEDLYPTVIDKAAALGFLIIMNYPFVDGNKRTGHAAMETFLILNGFEISASVDEQDESRESQNPKLTFPLSIILIVTKFLNVVSGSDETASHEFHSMC